MRSGELEHVCSGAAVLSTVKIKSRLERMARCRYLKKYRSTTSMMRFLVFLCLWSVTSCLCIYRSVKSQTQSGLFFIKVKTLPRPLKRLIQTRPHMSTSRCGKICITPPKCTQMKEGITFILPVVLLLPPLCRGDAVCFV